MSSSKGIVMESLLGIALVLIIVGVGVYIWTATHPVVPTTGGANPSQLTFNQVYYYDSSVQPYVNFVFQDKAGNTINPQMFVYSDPSLSINAPFWGVQRRWADTAGNYVLSPTASGGRIQMRFNFAVNTIYFHVVLAGYQDYFGSYAKPTQGAVSAGDAQSTSIGLSYPSNPIVLPAFDNTAWTSSNITMAWSQGFSPNTEAITPITTSFAVAKNEIVSVDQVKITSLTNFDTSSLRRLEIQIGGVTLVPYDHDRGIDKTSFDPVLGRVYDSTLQDPSSLFSGGKYTVSYSQDQTPSLQVRAFANNDSMTTGKVIGKLSVYSPEGHAIVDGVYIVASVS